MTDDPHDIREAVLDAARRGLRPPSRKQHGEYFVMEYPNVATAKLPANYERARDTLKLCAKHFSPDLYALAVVALGDCLARDECAEWDDQFAALGSYARMSNDKTLHRLIRRIELKRAAWKRELQSTPMVGGGSKVADV